MAKAGERQIAQRSERVVSLAPGEENSQERYGRGQRKCTWRVKTNVSARAYPDRRMRDARQGCQRRHGAWTACHTAHWRFHARTDTRKQAATTSGGPLPIPPNTPLPFSMGRLTTLTRLQSTAGHTPLHSLPCDRWV